MSPEHPESQRARRGRLLASDLGTYARMAAALAATGTLALALLLSVAGHAGSNSMSSLSTFGWLLLNAFLSLGLPVGLLAILLRVLARAVTVLSADEPAPAPAQAQAQAQASDGPAGMEPPFDPSRDPTTRSPARPDVVGWQPDPWRTTAGQRRWWNGTSWDDRTDG